MADLIDPAVNIMGIQTDLVTLWKASYWGNIILLVIIIFFWMMAGEWISAFAKAWWKKGAIVVEWTKTKKYIPYVANIPKDFKSVIELPNHRGIVGIRRDSIGSSANKVPIMLFSTEFAYTVSPQEINGERYFKIDPEKDLIYGKTINREVKILDKIDMIGEKDFDTYIKYPSTTISANEFVKYQNINADPLLYEGYAQHKENALREKINNPIAVMIGQYGWIIIIVLVAGAIAYTMVTQNNMAMQKAGEVQALQQHITDLYAQGICKGNPAAALPNYNATALKTGGGVL
jgi:hypothetical protein